LEYTCTFMWIRIFYIYIYIYRERERERISYYERPKY
jgi:hypothetical protein